ncbi:phenylalanyl-trna synthetase alpha chain [Ceraceosorus bombacis]|uniref:phenylalanine--tRNA ligase n=1 Tax=Ceraceosorus bombacis TaxID=401625 RepID=A0A0P1B9T2_9BASI|nr:phenylalanyl-trna synthetase alpha chain [Ceraceosorus bombacis]
MGVPPYNLSEQPSAEDILQLLDNAGSSGIPDTRTLAVSPDNVDLTSLTSLEAAHRARADWQLGLQSTLSSLRDRDMVTFDVKEELSSGLTEEGNTIANEGSHEARLWAALPADAEEGKSMQDLQTLLTAGVLKIAQGKAFAKKWVRKHPSVNGALARVPGVDNIVDETRTQLAGIRDGSIRPSDKDLAELRKRKLIVAKKWVYFSLKKGPAFALKVEKLETDLSFEMLQNGSWKDKPFKKYNFEADGVEPSAGALHPLLKVREEFRNIFFEMGFTEMPTNRFVESSFWCFDSLFVPQQHAARDVQDTFFVKDPPAAKDLPEDYLKKVTQVHEEGGFGSTGYRYPFSREVTEKLVLRTHTTAVSSAMLYQLANAPGGFKPAKLFSIDRVFRNEAVDATHLAEFHQVEGVVADYNITLGDLIGFMQIFFEKMGVKDLRFKPAFNPYTEPSLEIFSYHKGLGKWVEIGNSGIFRPEMLRPMGLPDGVNVLGWGLSLERPTMIRYGINNIRELVGHKVDIEGVEKAAAVRFP